MKYLYLAAIILFGSISSLMGDVDTAWVRMYDGNLAGTDRATAITVDDLGNVYVTGYTNGYGITEDIATVKYDPDGDTVWVRTYNGPGDRYDNGKDVYVVNAGVDGQSTVGHIKNFDWWFPNIPDLKVKYFLFYNLEQVSTLS